MATSGGSILESYSLRESQNSRGIIDESEKNGYSREIEKNLLQISAPIIDKQNMIKGSIEILWAWTSKSEY